MTQIDQAGPGNNTLLDAQTAVSYSDAEPRSAYRAETSHRSAHRTGLIPYVSIARPDHWFKNVFMLFGMLLAYLYYPTLLKQFDLGLLLWAFASTCLVASSNYVINEILDAPTDRSHPTKQHRPIPSGQVKLPIAYIEWLLLGLAGLLMAYQVNTPFFSTSAVLLMMGLVYNISPVRTKELPYLDVISESINNPLRLMFGWFVVSPRRFRRCR